MCLQGSILIYCIRTRLICHPYCRGPLSETSYASWEREREIHPTIEVPSSETSYTSRVCVWEREIISYHRNHFWPMKGVSVTTQHILARRDSMSCVVVLFGFWAVNCKNCQMIMGQQLQLQLQLHLLWEPNLPCSHLFVPAPSHRGQTRPSLNPTSELDQSQTVKQLVSSSEGVNYWRKKNVLENEACIIWLSKALLMLFYFIFLFITLKM